MTDEPFVPFYKPYGMDDQEYQQRVAEAEQELAEWQEKQNIQSIQPPQSNSTKSHN